MKYSEFKVNSRHIKSVHTVEAPFDHKACEKRFKDKWNLKIHERNHTLGTSLINVRLVTKNSSKVLL